MDCPSARLLLAYRRPGGPAELAPEDAADLDRHLAGCPACAAAARRQDGFDRAVATAMRAVPVPAGLRERLVTDALARQGAIWRRKVYEYATRAAILVVGALTVYSLALAFRPAFDTDVPIDRVARNAEDPERSVRDFLIGEGLPPTLPRDFNFTLVDRASGRGYDEINGRHVPRIVFQLPPPPGADRPDFAKVYVVRKSRFRLGPDKFRTAQNSFCTTIVVPDDGSGVAYVIVFTTPSLEPFLRPRSHENARAGPPRRIGPSATAA